MTSYTRKLFHRDPAAAEQCRTLAYGKRTEIAQFTPAAHGLVPSFGKRLPTGQKACIAPCGHPACTKGCTLR